MMFTSFNTVVHSQGLAWQGSGSSKCCNGTHLLNCLLFDLMTSNHHYNDINDCLCINSYNAVAISGTHHTLYYSP